MDFFVFVVIFMPIILLIFSPILVTLYVFFRNENNINHKGKFLIGSIISGYIVNPICIYLWVVILGEPLSGMIGDGAIFSLIFTVPFVIFGGIRSSKYLFFRNSVQCKPLNH